MRNWVYLNLKKRSSSCVHSTCKESHTRASSISAIGRNLDIAVGISSDIQLTVLDWYREFCKGYMLLRWVCLYLNDTDSEIISINTNICTSGSGTAMLCGEEPDP